MDDQIESWQLSSGTWYRNPDSESWRLATTHNGTVVNARLSPQDVGRLVGARRDTSTGEWLPSDFHYSPKTGTALQASDAQLDLPWIAPCGEAMVFDIRRPMARGLKQTHLPLSFGLSNRGFDAASGPDASLPALPPGHYRFLVHRFDAATCTLMAVEPQRGHLLALLPESRTWVALEPAAAMLAEGPVNHRAWRMELLEGIRDATLYFPTARGLAVVTPSLIGLSYVVEYFGEGVAIGGPVAWAGKTWLPVAGKEGVVHLVGKPQGSARPTILPTEVPIPKSGFESPVFDPHHVIWPGEDGQLVLRLDRGGIEEAEFVAWPEGLRPAFPLGCPYLSLTGAFWQLCTREPGGSFEYVQMGKPRPERAAVDGPRLGTGRITYRNARRIEGDPWALSEPVADESPSEAIVPLLEFVFDRSVVGLRIDAPQGVLALLASGERQRAVLQLQSANRADVLFGMLSVTRPWLTSLFVYNAHLWVHHPELAQSFGWKLEH